MEHIKTNPISTFLEETKEELLSRSNKPINPYNSLPQVNGLTWGIKPQELMTVAARTSMGKTAYCLQLILDLMQAGRSVFYMSFEMKPKKILERLFANKYMINNLSLANGGFIKYQKEWDGFCEDVRKMRFVMGDGFGADWKELNRFLNDCSVKPDIVIVDYIQGIATNNRNQKDFIDEYLREFRYRLVDNDIAGIIVSQLNRNNPDSKNKEPQLHQLKGSGALEEHSDSVILLDWLYKTTKNANPEDYKIHVAKNRNGRTGYVEARFMPQYYKFEEKTEIEKVKDRDRKKEAAETNGVGWDE